MKRIFAVILAVLILMSTGIGTIISSASGKRGWNKDATGWWYTPDAKTYYSNGWKQIDNEWYLFDSKGYIRYNWQKVDGSWYFMKSSGAMATGWVKWQNDWYYMNNSGKMLTNTTVDGWKIGSNGVAKQVSETSKPNSDVNLATNINASAYKRLKNYIITNGKKTDYNYDDEQYVIFHSKKSENYSAMLEYTNIKLDDGLEHEFITTFLSSNDDVVDLMIIIYKDQNPDMVYSLNFDSGNEYQLFGKFPYSNKPYVEEKNEIPTEIRKDAYILLNDVFALTDIVLQDYSGLSLDDFGIMYSSNSYSSNSQYNKNYGYDELKKEDVVPKKEELKSSKTDARKKSEYEDYIEKYKKFYLTNGMTMEDLEKDAMLVSGYGYVSEEDPKTDGMSKTEKNQYEWQKVNKKDYEDYIEKYKNFYLTNGMTMEDLEKDARLTTGYDPENKWGI